MHEVGSFLKGIFFGHIEEELLFPYPSPQQAEAEVLNGLLDGLRTLGRSSIDPARIDREERIPQKLLDELRGLGLFGLSIPPRFGGLGLSCGSWCRVIEGLARLDPSLALTVGAHLSLGTQGLLLHGTEEQKLRWLPRLASGESLAAFALTEAESGSDVAALRTRAEPDEAGGFCLYGSKVHVINGGLADLFTVFARIGTEQGGRKGITAFLVPRSPGLGTGPEEGTLGIRGSSVTHLDLDGTAVQPSQVLGEQGAGFKVAVGILNLSRLAVAAGCLGQCKAALDLTVDHIRTRHAFGRPISQLGMIQRKIGQMVVDTYVLDSLVYLTTGIIDSGLTDNSMECAVAKVFASETTWRVVNECLQVAGGIGYLRSHPFERLLRDARLNMVFSGTNEILRVHIALAGLAGPMELLRGLSDAIRRPLRSIGLLSDYALALFNRRWKKDAVTLVHERVEELSGPFVDLVARFGELAERLLRRHGKEIIHRQFTQERLANIIIDLYSAFATLSRTSRLLSQGDQERGREALGCTTIFLSQAAVRIARSLDGCDENEDELLRDLSLNKEQQGGSRWSSSDPLR